MLTLRMLKFCEGVVVLYVINYSLKLCKVVICQELKILKANVDVMCYLHNIYIFVKVLGV